MAGDLHCSAFEFVRLVRVATIYESTDKDDGGHGHRTRAPTTQVVVRHSARSARALVRARWLIDHGSTTTAYDQHKLLIMSLPVVGPVPRMTLVGGFR